MNPNFSQSDSDALISWSTISNAIVGSQQMLLTGKNDFSQILVKFAKLHQHLR